MNLGWFETSLPVADIRRSLAFYQTLGFRQASGTVDNRNVTLQRADCRLSLFQGYLEPDELQLIFWQGDVAGAAKELTGQGVNFFIALRSGEDPRDQSFMIKDPDGHPIYVITMPHEGLKPAMPPEHQPDAPDLGWYELSLVTKDVGVAATFYRKLGFRFVETNDEGRSVTLQSEDCRITLFQDVLDPAETQMMFWQGDVGAIVADLTAKGLRFEAGPANGAANGPGVGALLRDPDGHAIYFVNVPGETRKEPV